MTKRKALYLVKKDNFEKIMTCQQMAYFFNCSITNICAIVKVKGTYKGYTIKPYGILAQGYELYEGDELICKGCIEDIADKVHYSHLTLAASLCRSNGEFGKYKLKRSGTIILPY